MAIYGSYKYEKTTNNSWNFAMLKVIIQRMIWKKPHQK